MYTNEDVIYAEKLLCMRYIDRNMFNKNKSSENHMGYIYVVKYNSSVTDREIRSLSNVLMFSGSFMFINDTDYDTSHIKRLVTNHIENISSDATDEYILNMYPKGNSSDEIDDFLNNKKCIMSIFDDYADQNLVDNDKEISLNKCRFLTSGVKTMIDLMILLSNYVELIRKKHPSKTHLIDMLSTIRNRIYDSTNISQVKFLTTMMITLSSLYIDNVVVLTNSDHTVDMFQNMSKILRSHNMYADSYSFKQLSRQHLCQKLEKYDMLSTGMKMACNYIKKNNLLIDSKFEANKMLVWSLIFILVAVIIIIMVILIEQLHNMNNANTKNKISELN